MAPFRKPTPGERRIMRERAKEWKQFRRDYLFSAADLAAVIRCSQRTVYNIESGRDIIYPMPQLLRRFRLLKLRTEAEMGALRQRCIEVA